MKRIIQAVVASVLLSGASGVWAFGVSAETNVGQGALESYADRHERQGTLLSGSASTPAVEAETNVGQGYAASKIPTDTWGSAGSPFPISADSFDLRDVV
jgi:hypothetical protein